MHQHIRGTRRIAAVPAALLLTLVAACAGGERDGADSARQAAAEPAACPGDNAGLTLPAGFCATIFADSIGDARHVAVAPNGDVYVTLEAQPPSPEKAVAGDRQPAPSAVVALRDTSRDGRADVIERFGEMGGSGIAWANGHLWVDQGPRIVRYALDSSTMRPTGAGETIVSGLPTGGHRSRDLAFGPDGSLLVNVGSRSNSCQVKDRGNESPGHDPCTELETRAGIWRFDANRTGQRFTSGARWASGLRNAMGIAVNPANNQVYATQHGRDQLVQNWPKIFPDTKYSAENPAEELHQVNQGDVFAWPYCFWSHVEKKYVTAPEYGGDGRKTDRCETFKQPVALFPGHWAPMSLLFYTGTAFPEKYRGGAFIAFHGSWNRAPEHQQGYRVVFQPMKDGKGDGDYETFADGFAAMPAEQVQPGNAKHRPVGLAQAPDGALYVTDDTGGRVYRITYGRQR